MFAQSHIAIASKYRLMHMRRYVTALSGAEEEGVLGCHQTPPMLVSTRSLMHATRSSAPIVFAISMPRNQPEEAICHRGHGKRKDAQVAAELG